MSKMVQVGKLIRLYRESRGWSQAHLAKILSCAPSTIAMYESGQRQPSFDMLEALADVFNVSMRDLMPDTGVNNHPIISTEPWNPDDMGKPKDENMEFINRVAGQLYPDETKRLRDFMKVLFGEDFDENGNRIK